MWRCESEEDHDCACCCKLLIHRPCMSRAGATSPVGQVSTGPLFSPSALTADLGDYDVRGSIYERSTGSTELAA